MPECFDYARGTPLMLIYCKTAVVSSLHKGIQTFRRQFLNHREKFERVLLNFTDRLYLHR